MPKLFVTPKKNSRKTWIIAAAIIVVLAAAGGGYYYWTTTQNSAVSEDPSIKKLDDNKLTAEINTLMSNKEYEKAEKLIEYQDDSETDPYKIVLLAYAKAEKGDTTAAIATLTTASTKNTQYAYYFKGHEAKILADSGDTQGALAKYQEAIDLARKTTGSDEDETFFIAQQLGDYDYAINQLKKAQ